ncbi:hypothetical protein [Actinokineospora bangkokensis]|uniref:MalT-like TPR region domain-containing protein n=1 Tax=Actinokineospora bangkokensis TaxID=1193682 RepID=A0A1Q9LIY1_9PSEU|nr:hypothetical protein [Actinokineospora bangkokensis]OLR91960.1 hypothetical protein BJP25_24385 [Actinokineospora bangkokensis]
MGERGPVQAADAVGDDPAVAVLRNGVRDGQVVVLARTAEGIALVERCADTFPGRLVWTTLVGGGERGVRARMAAEVDRAARELLGVDTGALRPEQARAVLAEGLSAAGEPVLWVVDGVEGASPELVLPSPAVQTILIGQCAEPPWPVAPIAAPPGAAKDWGQVRGHARLVLAFAALLGAAPFSEDLVVEGLAEVLGEAAGVLVAPALGELARAGLVRGGPAGWRLDVEVGRAVRHGAEKPLLAALAARAAWLVERALGLDDSPRWQVHAHALADNPMTARSLRLALLRTLARGYGSRGALLAAQAAREQAVGIGDELEDALAAARLAVATGDTGGALRHTARIVGRARADADEVSEYRARFLAAQAHDLRGALPLADHVFHDHPIVAAHGPHPSWASAAERAAFDLGRARAARLRGRFADGLALVRSAEGVEAEVERARLQLLTGDPAARETAQRVVARLEPRHHSAVAAATVVALSGTVSVDGVQRLSARVARWYGDSDELTAELRVGLGMALLGRDRPVAALDVLVDVARRAGAGLGEEHPLVLRARVGAAAALGAAGDWAGAVERLTALLPRVGAVLGREHPVSRIAGVVLGYGLTRTGRGAVGRRMLWRGWRQLRACPVESRRWRGMVLRGWAPRSG